MITVNERIRQRMVSLHMARAIDEFVAEDLNLREGRRIDMAFQTVRLMPMKSLERF